MRRFVVALCLMAMVMSADASAHSYQQGAIRIGHMWARATPAGATTAAIYVPFLNTGEDPDRLVGASSELAEKIEIHQDMHDDGVMKMQKLEAITLEPHKPVSLHPGGIHLMVIGLKQPLVEGAMFPLTLQFEKAGVAKVEARIEAIGAMSGSH